jgi:6-phospho-beta-glucosidase
MKIAVIGGAGVRTPLLVGGLTGSDLPIDRIALYDEDPGRLRVIGGVAELMSGRRVEPCASLADCVAGADFVFTSIRVGGIAQRVHDEAVAQRHGIVGQETVGPAGFAMAMRNIPPMVRYAHEIAGSRRRPGSSTSRTRSAWSPRRCGPRAIASSGSATPRPSCSRRSRALGLDSGTCLFDYFGLNHLGWLREVYNHGEPQLHRMWRDEELLRRVYKVPLFDPASLKALKLLPTEYVYYYDQPARAFDNVRRAGQSRGQVIEEQTRALFEALGAPGADPAAIYKSYLRTRSASYMQIESGSDDPAAPAPATGLSGYDRIALGVLRAIHFNANTIIPLSVVNRGTIGALREDDVVEVPCVVNANGARPLHVGAVPERVLPLLKQVKDYERLTVRAAVAPSLDAAREALARNPLVPDRAAADALIDDLSPLW